MPSSAVDICNLALSYLGDEAEVIDIDPPDGTIQAAQCGRFYPIARDKLLEMHPWTFATVRVNLALVADPVPNPSEWAFAYSMPAEVLKPRAIYMPDGKQDDRGEDYIVESDADGNGVIRTNVENAILRYTRLVEDPTKFTPGFTLALARLLASMLAGPIIKGTTGMQVATAQLRIFQSELAIARSDDANTGQRSEYTKRVPDIVKARGYLYDPYGYRR